MSDKRCECHGINLLVDLMDAYALWGERNPQYKEKARKTGLALQAHIKEQANKPGNESLRKAIESEPLTNKFIKMNRLEREEHETIELRFGDAPFSSLDNIRDDIHQLDEIKQLVVCGGPYSSSDTMEFGVGVVKLAFSLLDEPVPPCGMRMTDVSVRDAALMAREPLADYAKALECEGT